MGFAADRSALHVVATSEDAPTLPGPGGSGPRRLCPEVTTPPLGTAAYTRHSSPTRSY